MEQPFTPQVSKLKYVQVRAIKTVSAREPPKANRQLGHHKPEERCAFLKS